ncbi:HAD-like protein, partial [Dacryopinax primogenitus]
QYKAVVFDIGGVLLSSPVAVIRSYSSELGLPADYLNVFITNLGATSAWARFERAELSLWEFYDLWSQELSDAERGKVAYSQWLAKRGQPAEELKIRVYKVDGRELFGRMMREAAKFDPWILAAVQKLRALGKYKVLALTNNYTAAYDSLLAESASSPGAAVELRFLGWTSGPAPESMRALFDDFVDSSFSGCRKPEEGIYDLLLERNGLKGEECVYLDDIGENLIAGKGKGMRTIRVVVGKTREAVEELERVLGVRL